MFIEDMNKFKPCQNIEIKMETRPKPPNPFDMGQIPL
jgi:hypothetical protein